MKWDINSVTMIDGLNLAKIADMTQVRQVKGLRLDAGSAEDLYNGIIAKER